MPEVIDFIANVIGIVGAIFAFFAFLQSRQVAQELKREQERKQQVVTVQLRNGSRTIELPVQMCREELSRAELLGRLGMIPVSSQLPEVKQVRYSLPYLNTKEFFDQLNEAIQGDGTATIEISCTDQEFDQFDLNKWNRPQ